MQVIADFHTHSRFARACSKFLTLPSLDNWARAKGTNLLGTSDFTHPIWFVEIQEQLEPVRDGIFRLKPQFRDRSLVVAGNPEVEFILSAEIATIWSQDGKLRRMHTLLLAPNLAAVAALNAKLGDRWKLGSDGRPMLGMSARLLAETAWEVDERFVVIPAHAWTPWFAIFGSMSGFDSLTECYGDLADRIYAIETGHSSDPAMNWRVSALDSVALISSSDAHSVQNLGREATVFEVTDPLTFDLVTQMIKEASPTRRAATARYGLRPDSPRAQRAPSAQPAPDSLLLSSNFLSHTIEFFPEEGKYHFDGHRACGVRLHPDERKKLAAICPSCGRPVTIGVYSRVADLADRPEGFRPEGAPDFTSIIPLSELVAIATGKKGKLSKSVTKLVEQLWASLGNEFKILLETPLADIARATSPEIAAYIGATREKKLTIDPGYDGVYGTIQIPTVTPAQTSLFTK